jgi:site-specific recombinase XerD
VDSARSARNDAQTALQAVVKDREDLAQQLKEQRVSYEDALRAIKLLEKEYEEQHKKLGVAKEKLARATAASSVSNLRNFHHFARIPLIGSSVDSISGS